MNPVFQFFETVYFVLCGRTTQNTGKLNWGLSRGVQMKKRGILSICNKFVKFVVLFLFNVLFWFFPNCRNLICPFPAYHYRKAYEIRIFLDDGLDSGLFSVFLLFVFQVDDNFSS